MRWKAAGVLLFAFVGAQFVQPITVPPAEVRPLAAALQAPGDVLRVIDTSCRDCHTWTTKWPWYSRIAPLSWVIARDVERGREFLNFSEWSAYPRAKKLAFTAAIASATNQERMPPPRYLVLHPEARLSGRDREVIKSWARTEFRRLATLRSSRSPKAAQRRANGS